MALFLRGAGGLSFELGPRGQETLGTASRCSLVCPASSGLEPEHARLRQVGGRWLLEAASQQQFRIGTQPPSRMVWLTTGSAIEFVGTNFRLTVSDQPSDQTGGVQGLQTLGSPRDTISSSSQPVPLGTVATGSPRPATADLRGSAGILAFVAAALLVVGGGVYVWSRSGPPVGSPNGEFVPAGSPAPVDPQPPSPPVPPVAKPDSPPSQVTPPSPTLPRGVVWLGLQGQTKRLLCTGWLIAPDRVLTIGDLADVFDQTRQAAGTSLFAYCDAAQDPEIAVKDVRRPRQSSADAPDPDFHFAVFQLDRSWPAEYVISRMPDDLLRKVRGSTPLRVVGYDIPIDPKSAPELFDQLKPPELVALNVKLTGSRQLLEGTGAPTMAFAPIGPTQPHGWLVCDERDHAVGLACLAPDRTWQVIPVDRLESLPTAAQSTETRP